MLCHAILESWFQYIAIRIYLSPAAVEYIGITVEAKIKAAIAGVFKTGKRLIIVMRTELETCTEGPIECRSNVLGGENLFPSIRLLGSLKPKV